MEFPHPQSVKKFVDHIAEYIQENQLDPTHLTLILPSERMRKYVAAAIVTAHGKPILAPTMITMDQWVKSLASKTVIDSTRGLLELFKIQCDQAKTPEDLSFDEFMQWGTTLLNDFNEIDRYLLDAKQIFRNLAEIKEIENWSFGQETLTASQKRFMEFWDRLPGYYYALNTALDAKNQCYMGRAYKSLALEIQRAFQEDSDRVYLFAGFNALSPAEKSIIKQLDQYGRGHVLVDADSFYYGKKTHEAGTFLRDLSEFLDQRKLDRVVDTLSSKALNIDCIECVQKTGQVKVAAAILSALTPDQLNETLLLLADETLISSMVKNLPSSIGKANITLGLPIRNTSIKTWVDLLFNTQENRTRFRTKAFYFQDMQAFWNHPLVQATGTPAELKDMLKLEKTMVSQNRIFMNPETVKTAGLPGELLEILALDWNSNWSEAITSMRKANQLIYARLEDSMAFERAIIQCFDQALVDMENLASEGLPEMGLKSFRVLFNQHWSRKNIAYHGNPIEGLQIMGMLETRGLDFKRIICLGLNEGHLPPTNPIQTMVPMDLRRFHGLPTPREKQGIFAHHFYRLLHHCDELIVTYSSADESIGSSEPSRYLLQLEMELARINPNLNLSKRMYALQTKQDDVAREIEKSPEILQRLDELFAASTSASMLKSYLTCPLDFYFRYVMDFGESDSVEEEIEHSTFGTFIHDTLEILYKPFARRQADGTLTEPQPPNITSLDVERMLKNYRVVLDDQFLKHFNGQKDAFTKGKNLLSYKMAQELTERFLKAEVKFLAEQKEPVFIEALEMHYDTTIDVVVHGETKKVRLKGIIDRVDSVGGRTRIVDYKTGKVQKSDVELRQSDKEAAEIVETMGAKKHVLQLMLYAYLFHSNEGQWAQPAIISFVSGNCEPFVLDTKSLTLEEIVEGFPSYVAALLELVYDPNVPFAHTQRFMSFCNYCA